MVDNERYLKKLVRYIHLNPVRAGIVKLPSQYQWSSHNAYLGNTPLAWLSPDNLLRSFSEDKNTATTKFNNFVLAGIGLQEDIDFKRGTEDGILGGENFVQMIQSSAALNADLTLCLEDIVIVVCDFFGIALSTFIAPGKTRDAAHVRSVLALIIRESHHLTLEELGALTCREASGLSKLAARLNTKWLTSPEQQNELFEIKSPLAQMSECQA